MSDRFEELIKASADEMPDPGEYRRLNRSALRAPLHDRERPARRHLFVMATTCLAIMILFSGQLAELGSDDFELDISEGTDALGGVTGIYRDKFSGTTLQSTAPEGDAKELILQQAADEGVLHHVSGLSYGGKTNWSFAYRYIVNGKESISSKVKNPPGYPYVQLANEFHFLLTYYKDLMDWFRLSPPIKEYEVEIEGTRVLMQTWEKTYPGYGLVTYTRGTPVPSGP